MTLCRLTPPLNTIEEATAFARQQFKYNYPYEMYLEHVWDNGDKQRKYCVSRELTDRVLERELRDFDRQWVITRSNPDTELYHITREGIKQCQITVI